MISTARATLAASGLVAATVLSACGGTGGVDPVAYVSDVCTAFGGYQSDVMQSMPELNAGTLSSPAKARETLSSYLDSVITETDSLVTSLNEAGIPDVEKGKKIANGLVDSFRRVEQSFKSTQAKLQALPNDPAAFREGLLDIAPQIQDNLSQAADGLKKLQSDELNEAAGQSKACQSL